MKKLIAIVLAATFLVLPCSQAGWPAVLAGSPPSACSTARNGITGATSATYTVGGIAGGGNNYVGVHFTTTAAYTVCKVTVPIKKVGSPTFNIRARIFSDAGGSPNYPNAGMGTASDPIAASSLSTTTADVAFTGMSAILSDATVYWVVLYVDAAGDASNYVAWDYEADTGVTAVGESPDGVAGNWSNSISNNIKFKFQAYSN